MVDELANIGFYTLSDDRAKNASSTSRLMRCELILTSRCNFSCPYCRHVGGKDIKFEDAINIVDLWAKDNLRAIRFSGGEPTIWYGKINDDRCLLSHVVKHCVEKNIEKIAISTNGSAKLCLYEDLITNGENDISISLDACCAEDGDKMAGGVKGAWDIVVSNIKSLSKLVYVTVGVVLTNDNVGKVNDIIRFADGLGVADIRIIPAAQDGNRLKDVYVDDDLLKKHPILAYRIANIQANKPVRGLQPNDYNRCGLVLDDMACCDNKHFPCIIYMREGGNPIGAIGPDMRKDRLEWFLNHNTKNDPICSSNCLDVCCNHNRIFRDTNPLGKTCDIP